MKQLVDILEGILDKDFDVPESALSILNNCRRVQNDLYDIPRISTLRSLEKYIKPDIPVPDKLDFKYNWAEDYPAVQRILSWIASKPKSWLDNQSEQAFTDAFEKECLTKLGLKKKWGVIILPIIIPTLGAYEDAGRKIGITMRTGSNWTIVARLAAYTK